MRETTQGQPLSALRRRRHHRRTRNQTECSAVGPDRTEGVSSAAATFVDEIVSTARELEHPNTYPTTILDGFQAMVRAAGTRHGVCARSTPTAAGSKHFAV